MRDLPAPQHSEALNSFLNFPTQEPPPPVPVDAIPRLEADRRRRELRRRAAERARARHEAA
jgi:hypothetical protein